MTSVGGFWRTLALDGGSVVYALSLIQLVTGAPTSNTLVDSPLLYAVMLCGASLACGLDFLTWRGVLFATNSCLRMLVYTPAAAIRADFRRLPPIVRSIGRLLFGRTCASASCAIASAGLKLGDRPRFVLRAVGIIAQHWYTGP